MTAFVPAGPVQYTDAQHREYEFTQDAHGAVSARVYFGLANINTVAQGNIEVQTTVRGMLQDVSMGAMDAAQRKAALEAFQRVLATRELEDNEFQIVNGGPSAVENRHGVGFFNEVRSITLVL